MSDQRAILIADGDPTTVPDMEAVLHELGYEALRAADALFVQTLALRHRPDAIVLGAHLPAGGPLTALRRLRGSVHTASTPVIAVAVPGAGKQDLLSAGVDFCLDAPVIEPDLVAALQEASSLARAVTGAPEEILQDPERLSALSETNLLDTGPDEALDLVTRMAAQVLGAPVALVSLVDDRRQFFKSQVGLPSPWDQDRQTALSHSFCQWVVSSREELVVEDARRHPILRSNGAVADLGVIAYAGMPLSARSGETIGSFCAIDGEPRQWSNDELATLRDLAQVVDAFSALGLSEADGEAMERPVADFPAVARAGGRGVLGAVRMLKRGRPPLSDQQRNELMGIIERYSHRLIDVSGEAST